MTKKSWAKPEVTTLDVDQTLVASKKNQTEDFTNFFTAAATFFGGPAGS